MVKGGQEGHFDPRSCKDVADWGHSDSAALGRYKGSIGESFTPPISLCPRYKLAEHFRLLELVIIEEVDDYAHLVPRILCLYRFRVGKRSWIFCASQSLQQIGPDFSFILRTRFWRVRLDNACADLLQVVAATAGIAVGPLFAVPLGRRYGRTNIFFWSMVGLLVTGIWSATMTRSNQYGAFIAARLFGGLFGGVSPALGADTIVDMFFLHQRGKAFTVLNLSFLAGVVVGPTLSGFIVGSTNWTVQFWWSNGLEGIIILLTLALLHDTYYDRTSMADESRNKWPDDFFANRMATFSCGARVIPPISRAEMVSPTFNVQQYVRVLEEPLP